MIAGGKLAPTPALDAAGCFAGTRHRRGQVGLGDRGVGNSLAGQFVDNTATGENQDPIAKTLELDAVGG